MKRSRLLSLMLFVAISFVAIGAYVIMPATASVTPISSGLSATAGSGGVTCARFVKLSAAKTIVTATASSDAICGVCDLTAAAGALTRYAPPGTLATVTSGEAIAVGNMVTTDSAGKAVVAGSNAGVRTAGMAITAAADVDLPVTIVVTTASQLQPGWLADSIDVAADALVIPITDGLVQKTTGADAEALTLANGTAGQMLTITLVTDGGGDGTLTPATSSTIGTIVFADAGDTVTLRYIDGTDGWCVVAANGLTAQPAITQPS